MRISIITACYNAAATLGATMESVVRQSWADVEYIVVDGGSTDGTVDVIREFASGRDIKWISEPDAGMYDAVNKGIQMATGDVIGILNADDAFLDCDVIQRIAHAFTDEVDAVYSDVRFADHTGKIVRYYWAKHWRPWMLQWGFMPPHPGIYIRRECFERLGIYKLGYHIAADYELVIRFLRKNHLRTRYLDICAVEMRMGGKSTRDWRSNWLLNKEIVRANRETGYYCCLPMLVPKYLFKVFEFITPRVQRMFGKGKDRRTCG